MSAPSDLTETILIVDDEEPVRRTFREWLEEANLGCRILVAGDAAGALTLANDHFIDLAILDWNLGAGQDGLQLLEDLVLFNPDIVAILATGYANQATPLMAMRMGVRDFLDKNHDLDRPTFVKAVNRQLERLRPFRREKRLSQGLAAFRSAVERVLPLVQAASALHDPVPLPEAIRSLFAFLLATTGATAGVLLVHVHDPVREPSEQFRVYDATGRSLEDPKVRFSRSLAGSVVGMQEVCTLDSRIENPEDSGFELMPFERGRTSILAAPISVAPGIQVVLELFDRAGGFAEEQRCLVRAAAEFSGELLRHALAERQTQSVLVDALGAALRVSNDVTRTLGSESTSVEAPASVVMEELRAGFKDVVADGLDGRATVQLAEAIRVLAQRHGARAVEHCTRLVQDLRGLLDEVAGLGQENLG